MMARRLIVLLALTAASASAQPFPARPGDAWGGPEWGRGEAPPPMHAPVMRRSDPREGHVDVDRFKTPAAIQALGHGSISVASAPGSVSSGSEAAMFEAAVVDQLVKAGYDTTRAARPDGQVTELIVSRDVVQPEEPPHKPVSGEVDAEVGNHGSAVGMAVSVDLAKPLKALIATRLEARIHDRATNALLWQGRAAIITREGDRHWTNQALASRLAAALFRDFPDAPLWTTGIEGRQSVEGQRGGR